MSGGGVHLWQWGEALDPLRRAVDEGRIIAVPTESSYALAVDPRHRAGVRTVFRLKHRMQDVPLPVVAGTRAQVEALGELRDPRLERMASLWPAGLSLLLPTHSALPATAGSGRVAVRIPAHRRLRGLLEELQTPLTATSANRSGEPAITEVEEVLDLLAPEAGAVVVDGGSLPGGNPSTLVGVRGDEIEVLRLGAVSVEDLAACLGVAPEAFSAASVEIFADDSR